MYSNIDIHIVEILYIKYFALDMLYSLPLLIYKFFVSAIFNVCIILHT